MTVKPLDGIRVADFSWFGAGPIAGQALATYGAEVVRVESSKRLDSLRVGQPFKLDDEGKPISSYNVSGYFNNFNAGKLSFTLDMNTPKGKELAHRLVVESDVSCEEIEMLKQLGYVDPATPCVATRSWPAGGTI